MTGRNIIFKRLTTLMAVSIFLFSAVAATEALAESPFELIWQKLFDHEERITDLERHPAAGGIKVYDSEGQFLGISLGTDQGGETLYMGEKVVPSISD